MKPLEQCYLVAISSICADEMNPLQDIGSAYVEKDQLIELWKERKGKYELTHLIQYTVINPSNINSHEIRGVEEISEFVQQLGIQHFRKPVETLNEFYHTLNTLKH